jgi:hypothetical protein
MSVSGSTGTFVIRTPPAQVRCPYCAVLLCTLIACCPAATSSSNRYPRGYPASAPCCVRLDAPRVSNGQVSRSCVCVRAGRLRGGRRMQRFQRGEGRSRQWREPWPPLPNSEVSKQHVTRNSDAEVDARHGALRLCLAAVERTHLPRSTCTFAATMANLSAVSLSRCPPRRRQRLPGSCGSIIPSCCAVAPSWRRN